MCSPSRIIASVANESLATHQRFAVGLKPHSLECANPGPTWRKENDDGFAIHFLKRLAQNLTSKPKAQPPEAWMKNES
jgi:hypothetical protein